MENNSEAAELRGHLFQQLQKLSDPASDLDKEIKRAEAISKVATVIVNSHKQEVDMVKAAAFGNLKGSGNKKDALPEPKKLKHGK